LMVFYVKTNDHRLYDWLGKKKAGPND